MQQTKPRQPAYPVRVARSSAGLGLIAESDIPPNRFITEYWGEVVDEDTADSVAGKYLFDLGNGKAILGGTRKNIARYINHSCRANSEPRQRGNRIFIYSTKRIHAGEEISYDYGKEYFDAYIGPKGCRCKVCKK